MDYCGGDLQKNWFTKKIQLTGLMWKIAVLSQMLCLDEKLTNSSAPSSQNKQQIYIQQCLKAILQLNELSTKKSCFHLCGNIFKKTLHLNFESCLQSQQGVQQS